MGFYEEGPRRQGPGISWECEPVTVTVRRVAESVEQRSSFYGPLRSREGLGLWEAVPAAQVHRGSSGDQTHGGACRMERFVLSEDIPDRLGQLAGEIDPGDLGAALAAEPRFGALVSIAIATIPGGVGGGLDQAQRRYVGPFLASGPRRSLPPD